MEKTLQLHHLCDYVSRESGDAASVRPHLFVEVIVVIRDASVSKEGCINPIQVTELRGKGYMVRRLSGA
jgi:hypothetical protein